MDIKALLKKQESKTLEFKRDLSSLKQILKTIIAFANTASGILIIGIEDDGKIVGVSDIQKQQDKLANAISDNILPRHLLPEFEFYTIDKKDLLIVQVHHLPEPFYIKQQGDANGVYLRLGATTRQSPPEFIEEIKRRKKNKYFDEQPCFKAKMLDLDQELIKVIFKYSPYQMTEEKLLSLGLICKENGQVYPTNGGIILFGKK
jgi:ATP-dependent DNA helicase RecG